VKVLYICRHLEDSLELGAWLGRGPIRACPPQKCLQFVEGWIVRMGLATNTTLKMWWRYLLGAGGSLIYAGRFKAKPFDELFDRWSRSRVRQPTIFH
jgi:hypothetical protein